MPVVTSDRSSIDAMYLASAWYTYNGGATWVSQPTVSKCTASQGFQTTQSFRTGKMVPRNDEEENLAGVDLRREFLRTARRPQYDTGNEFWTENFLREWEVRKQEIEYFKSASWGNRYHGSLSLAPLTVALPSLTPPTSANQVNAWGAEGIRRSIPGTPQATSLGAILELWHDGFPKLMGSALAWHSKAGLKQYHRAAGEEYLNWQFGWKPLWRDCQKIWRSLSQASDLLVKWYENAGRDLHRKRLIVDDVDVTYATTTGLPLVMDYVSGASPVSTYFGSGSAIVEVLERTTTKVWFSGSFTYWAPDADDDRLISGIRRRLAEGNYLFGLEMTPELFWELAPFSWLADWFMDIGDILFNATYLSDESFAMRHGYLMVYREVERICTPQPKLDRGGVPRLAGYIVSTRTRKERHRANPYGFGLTWDGLTATQQAILAALGMTRGGTQLRLRS